MKETLKFTLEVEVDIDGRRPSDEVLNGRIIDAMNENFPSLMFDNEELDCAVFVNSWEYVPNVKITGLQQPETGSDTNAADCGRSG